MNALHNDKISHIELSPEPGILNSDSTIPAYHRIGVHVIKGDGEKYTPFFFRSSEGISFNEFYKKADQIRAQLLDVPSKEARNQLMAVVSDHFSVQSTETVYRAGINYPDLDFTDKLIVKAENCRRSKDYHSVLFNDFLKTKDSDSSLKQKANSIKNEIVAIKTYKQDLIDDLGGIYSNPTEVFKKVEGKGIAGVGELIQNPKAFGYLHDKFTTKNNPLFINRSKSELNDRLNSLSRSFSEYNKLKEYTSVSSGAYIQSDHLLKASNAKLQSLLKQREALGVKSKYQKMLNAKKGWIQAKRELNLAIKNHFSMAGDKAMPIEKTLKAKGLISSAGSSFHPAAKIIRGGINAVKKTMEVGMER